MFSNIPSTSDLVNKNEIVEKEVIINDSKEVSELCDNIKSSYNAYLVGFSNSLKDLINHLHNNNPPVEDIQQYLSDLYLQIINKHIKTITSDILYYLTVSNVDTRRLLNVNIPKMTEELLTTKQETIFMYNKVCEKLNSLFNNKLQELISNEKCEINYKGTNTDNVSFRQSNYTNWSENNQIDTIAIKKFTTTLKQKGYNVISNYKNNYTYDKGDREYINDEMIVISISV